MIKKRLVFIKPGYALNNLSKSNLENSFSILVMDELFSFIATAKLKTDFDAIVFFGNLKDQVFLDYIRKVKPYSIRDGYVMFVVSDTLDMDS
jgi:hypothetical protein